MSISVRRVRKTRYQSTSWEHDDVPFTRSKNIESPMCLAPSGFFFGRACRGTFQKPGSAWVSPQQASSMCSIRSLVAVPPVAEKPPA
jgi:hypothetical protein